MITNAEIKHIRSLREKKYREASGEFVVEGEKMVDEAIRSGLELAGIWRTADIGENAMSRISQLSSPSPVLAVLRIPDRTALPQTLRKELYLALDSVRDPGNLGTIIRIADWFGVRTVFASEDCVDLYNPKVVQASMGSVFRVKVLSAGLTDVCRRFRDAGMEVYGTVLDGVDIYKESIAPEGLVVMGNESVGISPQVRELLTGRLLIPSFGGSGAESLNVAIATAVTLSEFRRRQL